MRVTTAAGLGIRLPRGETKKAFIVGGKICVVEKSFSQPLLVSPSLSYWLCQPLSSVDLKFDCHKRSFDFRLHHSNVVGLHLHPKRVKIRPLHQFSQIKRSIKSHQDLDPVTTIVHS